MSLDSLSNPFERASTLPTVMVYRGTWVNGGQYYVNDVVTSPSDGQLYMLGLTALISTTDPAIPLGVSPWISFAGSVITGNPMEWSGTWSPVTTFKDGDVVIDPLNQQAYVCIATSSLNQPPSLTPASWAQVNPYTRQGVIIPPPINIPPNTANLVLLDKNYSIPIGQARLTCLVYFHVTVTGAAGTAPGDGALFQIQAKDNSGTYGDSWTFSAPISAPGTASFDFFAPVTLDVVNNGFVVDCALTTPTVSAVIINPGIVVQPLPINVVTAS